LPRLATKADRAALIITRDFRLIIKRRGIEMRLAGANEKGVTFSKPVVIELEARASAVFEDETYRINWVGDGFRVFRKTDGVPMTSTVANEGVARRELDRLYPWKAS
jgi:hypothetical protein